MAGLLDQTLVTRRNGIILRIERSVKAAVCCVDTVREPPGGCIAGEKSEASFYVGKQSTYRWRQRAHCSTRGAASGRTANVGDTSGCFRAASGRTANVGDTSSCLRPAVSGAASVHSTAGCLCPAVGGAASGRTASVGDATGAC